MSCRVCKSNTCTKSFHSFEEQERADSEREERAPDTLRSAPESEKTVPSSKRSK